MTQNTAWKNVERAIDNLKRAGPLTPEFIVSLPHEKLRELIRPAGFYNQKAERLRAVSEMILRYGGMERLSTFTTRRLRDVLLSVKGIGKETADSILLYAFGRPVFVVDKYTYRLFTRIGIWEGSFDYEGIREMVEGEIRDVEEMKEFHALIVEHSKRFCRKRPNCSLCPLREAFPCTFSG